MRKITKVIITLCCILSISGCGAVDEQPLTPVTEEEHEFKYTDKCLTEICVCQYVNADGSVILWGDRVENDLFFIYCVANTLDLQPGDEVALSYDETARQKAPTRQGKADITYILKKGDYILEPISPNLVKQAVDGSRKNKCLKALGLESEIKDIQPGAVPLDQTTSNDVQSNMDETSSEDEADEEDSDAKEEPQISYTMDATALMEDGMLDVTVTKGKKYILEIAGRPMILNSDFKYCFAEKIYTIDEQTYLGTVRNTPQQGMVLMYVNESLQIQAGTINFAQATPDGGYMIGYTPVDIRKIVK